MKKVHIAVVGAGWWATTAHLPALRDHPLAEIVAVQKRDPNQAAKVARDFGAARGCATMDEVLAIDGLDAVVISSTPNQHYIQAKSALERGLHVLLEKPMTITRQEAEELVQLADERKLVFMISCPWHFTRHALKARELIQSGALGSLKMISLMMTNFTVGLYQGLTWDEIFGRNSTRENADKPYLEPHTGSYSDPRVAGGGHIYCQISHVAAYLGFLTNSDPAEIFAQLENAGAPVDVYDALQLRLKNGALVSMASHGAPMSSRRNFEIRIFGTLGMIYMDLWDGTMEFHDAAGNVSTESNLDATEVYPMFAPTQNFVDCIAGSAANGSPASLGLYAMAIIESAVESNRSGRKISIAPLHPLSAARD